MILCINPDCKCKNPDRRDHCRACGSDLLLNGRYRVVCRIGKGGFGETYEVRDNGTAKVLKVLRRDGSKAVELFRREARMLCQLKHKGIPRGEEYFVFYAKNSQKPLHCLVMEYIKGKDLVQYQKRRGDRPISQKLALEWLLQLAEILHAVHGQQLFHRDIKPSNIILKPDGQLVLIDFGAIREISTTIMRGESNTSISSPGYTAPEQEKGLAVPQSDFFAIGRTFVYLLTGKHPTDKTIYNRRRDVMNWRPHASSNISPRLANFIDRLMEHQVDNRPRNTKEILKELEQIEGYLDPSSPAQPVPSTILKSRSMSKRREFIKIASFTALGALGALAWPLVWEYLTDLLKGNGNRYPELPPPPSVFSFEVVTVDARGREINRYHRSTEFFAEDLGNGVFLEMVSISGGSFMMGSPNSEKGRFDDESPHHPVRIPGFFMGKYTVTQAQWQALMGNNPSRLKGEDLPVQNVTWFDAVEFCQKLEERTGQSYRLPSEAEWEYACRAGTTTPFHFGETITTDLANYNGDYTYASEPKGEHRNRTTPVGSFPPNAFGLYDMHGNIWEWCADTWHENYQGAPKDGSAWIADEGNDSKRLLRGGASGTKPAWCRAATRSSIVLVESRDYSGFRVALSSARTS